MSDIRPAWPVWAALALIVLYTGQNFAWLLLDGTPPQSDSVYYLQGGMRLLDQIDKRGLGGLAAVPSLVPHRPPLQSLFGALMFSLFGKIPDRPVFLNGFWLSAAAGLTFVVGCRAGGPWIGLLACVYWMTNPFVHDFLHQFEPEVPLAAGVAASLGLLMRVLEEGRTRDFIFLGVVIAAGLLLKWLYGVILIAPLLTGLGYLFLKGTWLEETAPRAGFGRWGRAFLLLALFPVLLALPWYVSYWSDLVGYQVSIGDSGYFTPYADGWRGEVLLYYPVLLSLKIKAIHLFLLAAGFITSVYLALKSPKARIRVVLVLLMLSLVFPYVFFTIQYHNLAPKYLYPVQPVLAVLAAMLFSGLPERWKMRIVPVLCAGLLLLHAVNQWGWADWGTTSGRYIQTSLLKAETGLFDYRSHPPRQGQIPHRRLAEAIVMVHPSGDRPLKVLTLPNLEGFSAFTFSVWLQAARPQAESLGVSPYRIILDLLYHDFLITSRGPAHREKIHRDVADPFRYETTIRLARTLDDPPAWFTASHHALSAYAYQEIENGIELYQRSLPVQPAEAAEVIGLFAEPLLEYEFMWDQVAIVWRRLRDLEHVARARAFQAVLFQEEGSQVQELLQEWEDSTATWMPYEQYALGVLSLRRGQTGRGLDLLQAVAGLDTTCALPAAKALGAWALESGQPEQAIQWYQQAWNHTIYDRDIHSNLALAYGRMNQFEWEQCHHALENLAARLAFRNDRPELFQQAAALLRTFGETGRAEFYERHAARLESASRTGK